MNQQKPVIESLELVFENGIIEPSVPLEQQRSDHAAYLNYRIGLLTDCGVIEKYQGQWMYVFRNACETRTPDPNSEDLRREYSYGFTPSCRQFLKQDFPQRVREFIGPDCLVTLLNLKTGSMIERCFVDGKLQKTKPYQTV